MCTRCVYGQGQGGSLLRLLGSLTTRQAGRLESASNFQVSRRSWRPIVRVDRPSLPVHDARRMQESLKQDSGQDCRSQAEGDTPAPNQQSPANHAAAGCLDGDSREVLKAEQHAPSAPEYAWVFALAPYRRARRGGRFRMSFSQAHSVCFGQRARARGLLCSSLPPPRCVAAPLTRTWVHRLVVQLASRLTFSPSLASRSRPEPEVYGSLSLLGPPPPFSILPHPPAPGFPSLEPAKLIKAERCPTPGNPVGVFFLSEAEGVPFSFPTPHLLWTNPTPPLPSSSPPPGVWRSVLELGFLGRGSNWPDSFDA